LWDDCLIGTTGRGNVNMNNEKESDVPVSSTRFPIIGMAFGGVHAGLICTMGADRKMPCTDKILAA
jgi:hypothetical protein